MSSVARAVWFLSLSLLLAPAGVFPQSRSIPWHPQRGPNLIPDPNLSTPSEWHLAESNFCESAFDPTVSRSRPSSAEPYDHSCSRDQGAPPPGDVSGDGSIIMKPYDPRCRANRMLGSIRIPVEPGKTYTFAAFMRGSHWPSFVTMVAGLYDGNGNATLNQRGSRQATTAPNIWEEAAIPFTTSDFEWAVQLKVRRSSKEPQRAGCVWLDDLYLGEGIAFDGPPSPKRRFESDKVVIDELGNFFVREAGRMVPFFPVAIYGADERESFDIYKSQGFNTVMRAGYPGGMEKAARAGLYYTMDVTRFILDADSPGRGVGRVEAAADVIEGLYARVLDDGTRLADHLLMYYWDNEFLDTDWVASEAVLRAITSRESGISARDGGPSGRRHPIYVLQGNYGIARSYNHMLGADGRPLVDVMGTYVHSPDETEAPQRADALVFLDKLPGQTAPAAFGQITDFGNATLTASELRLRVYNILIAGGKAFGIFRDRYPPVYHKILGVENSRWWDELPKLVDEINKLMPIIQEPHWTEWQVSADTENLGIGTRDHDGFGYILVTNNNPFSMKTTFTIHGTPALSTTRTVIDYFQGNVVTAVEDSQFMLTLLANSTNVYKLGNEAGTSR